MDDLTTFSGAGGLKTGKRSRELIILAVIIERPYGGARVCMYGLHKMWASIDAIL